ncbi:MAG: hypothetical protein NTW07_04180 [candidate division Zixibacteria bacterium]|nr:hypothetical protein [candidate division Zixibacteria bacterium]
MKRRITVLSALLAVIFSMAVTSFAAETSVKGTVYSNWTLDRSEGKDNYNAFTIDRAYFGAESKLSDYTSMRITFDIRPERFSTSATNLVDSEGDTVAVPSLSAYSGYPIILKYAYADWKIKPVAKVVRLRFGLQPTMYLNNMDGLWGRRYIEKNVIDLNGWLSTSDLGLSALFALGPQGYLGEVGFSILNGTKYSDFVDKNSNKDLNFFGKLTPFYNSGDFNQVAFVGQVYLGTQNRTLAETESASDWKRQVVSLGGKLAYQKAVDFCFDLNFQTLGQGVGKDDKKQQALSFWGDLYLNSLVKSSSLLKTLVLFGRVDSYDPNTDVANDGDSYIIAGLECAPIKGVKASLGLRNQSFEKTGEKDKKYLFADTEFKF